MAKTYQTRPSDIYGITDDYVAWSFDRAVFLFGSTLDAELATAGNGARNDRQANLRRQRVLAKWLGTKVKYADPNPKAKAAPSQGVVTL